MSNPRLGPVLTSERLALVVGALVYSTLLQLVYVYDIHPRWSYMGLEHHALSWLLRVTLSAVAVLPALWSPIHLRRPSEVAYWFVYLTVFIPSVLIPYDGIGGAGQRWLMLSAVILVCMVVLRALGSLRIRGFPRPRGDHLPAQFWLAFWIATLLGYGFIALKFGLQFKLPGVGEIYEVRDEYKEMVRRVGPAGAYAVAWTGNVINPFLILWGFAKQRRSFLIAGILGQLLLFSITALKSQFFSTFLILAIYLAVRPKGRNFGMWMVYGAAMLVAAGMLEFRVFGTDIITGVIVRRLMVVPGHLMGLYVDFFSVNPKALLGYSILEGIVPYPYDVPPAQVMAANYFRVVQHANASVWADGFANFGYAGMVGGTILLGLVLRALDRAAVGIDVSIATALFGLPSFNLSNSGLLTSLLTHGIGLVILLLYLLPRSRKTVQPRARQLSGRPVVQHDHAPGRQL